MSRFKHLKIRQVDSALAPFREIPDVDRPGAGWIRAIREASGMSLRQLAERMGISKTTAATLERNESADTIKLSSLRAVGAALDCELIYALVPRTSLEDLVKGRARVVAEAVVGRVSDSMDLENQAIPAAEQERQVADLAERLWQEMPKELWDDPI
jgi:predicted DNA-binding mobile mystery protein A